MGWILVLDVFNVEIVSCLNLWKGLICLVLKKNYIGRI